MRAEIKASSVALLTHGAKNLKLWVHSVFRKFSSLHLLSKTLLFIKSYHNHNKVLCLLKACVLRHYIWLGFSLLNCFVPSVFSPYMLFTLFFCHSFFLFRPIHHLTLLSVSTSFSLWHVSGFPVLCDTLLSVTSCFPHSILFESCSRLLVRQSHAIGGNGETVAAEWQTILSRPWR